MKNLIIDSAALRKALQKLKPAINPRNVLPVLECVLLKVKKGKLTICATDTQLTIIHEMDCEAQKGFEMLLPYNELSNICAALPTCPLLIEQKDDLSTTISGEGKDIFKLGKMPDVINYLSLPDFSQEHSVQVDFNFFSALKQAAKTILDDKNEYVLSCVLIDFLGQHMKIVSTDKCQMFVQQLPLTSAITRQNCIYPEFIRAVAEVNEGELQVNEKFVCLKTDTTTYIGTCNDMRYIKYSMVLKELGNDFYKVSKKDLAAATEKILAVPSSVYKTTMNIAGPQVELSFVDADMEREAITSISTIDNALEPASFCMDIKRLKSLLSQLPTETEYIRMWIPNSTTMFIRPEGVEDKIECLLVGMVA